MSYFERIFWNYILCLIVIIHIVVVIFNLIAFLVLPFVTPWYISLPLCSFLFRLMLVGQECPLTNFENSCRRKLNKNEVRGFIKHYFVKPSMKIYRKAKNIRLLVTFIYKPLNRN